MLAAGQIRPYPSKKAAAEFQLSQFSQQQPMADLVKCLGEISIYCVHLARHSPYSSIHKK
jgi:hypothetical protein